MSRSSSPAGPTRGEVWAVDLDPVVGREQAGHRPALVVSADGLNSSPRGIVVVLPITTTDRRFPTHVPVYPPDAGLSKPSFIMTEQPRTISMERLERRYGRVEPETMEQVENLLRIVLGL